MVFLVQELEGLITAEQVARSSSQCQSCGPRHCLSVSWLCEATTLVDCTNNVFSEASIPTYCSIFKYF